MQYRICVVKYGYANIDADSEDHALELVNDMEDSDFDWSDFGNAEIMEEFED